MSTKAVMWAINEAETHTSVEFAVLVALANFADARGRGAYPSQWRLADVSRASERQVRRVLSELESRGIIVRGDQKLTMKYPAGRRPVVWDLAMESDFPGVSTERGNMAI